MKIKSITACLLFFSGLGANAFASATCVTEKVIGNKTFLCSSATIPNNSAISVDLNCNGYAVTIDCDLHSNPYQLSLAIVGPDGAKAWTSSDTRLRLVDTDGNGVSVSCSF